MINPEHMPSTTATGPALGCLIVVVAWASWTTLAVWLGYSLGRWFG